MVIRHRVDGMYVRRWVFPQGGLFTLLAAALALASPAHGKSATDLFTDNFYPVYHRSDDGPTVYTAFSLAEETGVYASSSAVFLENGLTHDFSTGYSGMLSAISYSFSYDATQYTFSSVSDYYDRFNFNAHWKNIDTRWVQDDYHREVTTTYATSIPYGQLKIGGGRYTDRENPEASYPFRNLQLSHHWREFSLTTRLQQRYEYTYESYTLSHTWRNFFSNQVQYLRDQTSKKTTFSSRFTYADVEYKFQLSQTEEQKEEGFLGHRITARHEFSEALDMQFVYDKTFEISNGFSMLINFEKVIDF